MKRALLVGVVLLSACGAPPPSETGFDLDLVVSRGLLDSISAFQVALVTNISTVEGGDCTVIRQKCIKDQVPANRFVQLHNTTTNKTQAAMVFPINLTVGSPNTQDLSLNEVPPGRDYGLIIEAISKDGTKLAGSECNLLPPVTAGANSRVLLRIQQYSPAKMCDPRLVP